MLKIGYMHGDDIGHEVVPELIQEDVNGPRIASEVRKLVAPERYAWVTRELEIIRGRLGTPGASRRAAQEIHKMVAG